MLYCFYCNIVTSHALGVSSAIYHGKIVGTINATNSSGKGTQVLPKQIEPALSRLENLCQGELQPVLHSYDYIQGLVFAVCAAPEIPMPEQWLVWVFNQRGQLSSASQADELTDILMTLMQSQLKDMRDENIQFPAHYQFEPTNDSMAAQWLSGLLAGHSQLESVWQSAWKTMADSKPEDMKTMQRDLKHCLMMFSTFADVPLAVKQAEQKNNQVLVERLPQIFLSLSDALNKYVALSGQLVGFMPDQFETFVKPH